MSHFLSDLDGGVLLLRLIQFLGEALDGPLGHTRHRGEHFDTKRGGYLQKKKEGSSSKVTESDITKHKVA